MHNTKCIAQSEVIMYIHNDLGQMCFLIVQHFGLQVQL